MTDGSETFLKAIALTEVPAEVFDRAFVATPQFVPWPKAYGGDMVAQAAASAIQTVDNDGTLHSMHSYFLRPVEIGVEVRYEVELLRDGRSFSTRQVRGFQSGKPVYQCTASFQVPEVGEEFQSQIPEVPAPESLPSSAEFLKSDEATNLEAIEYWSRGRSFDHRHIPSPIYLAVEGEHVAHQAVWVRAFDQLGEDANLHRLAIAYVCDYTILEPILRKLGLAWAESELVTASLDHAMWFHREARADDWLLYMQESPSLSSGRGLGLGKFYDRAGRLVATVAQEGMIRYPKPNRKEGQ